MTEEFSFRPMRRIRQQLSDEESVELLNKTTAGVLCLIGDGGYPYGVPISFVYRDGHIYMHSALKGHKVDAICKNSKASFTVISTDEIHSKEFTTYFRSVICFGRIRIIDDVEEKKSATEWLGRRYDPNDEENLQKEIEKSGRAMHMLDFTIEHMTGKEAIEFTRMRK